MLRHVKEKEQICSKLPPKLRNLEHSPLFSSTTLGIETISVKYWSYRSLSSLLQPSIKFLYH